MPRRMCCICRKEGEKSEFIRIACPKEDEPQFDKDYKIMGRGAYFCSIECLQSAQKRNALSRAFKRNVSAEVYEKILAGVSDGK